MITLLNLPTRAGGWYRVKAFWWIWRLALDLRRLDQSQLEAGFLVIWDYPHFLLAPRAAQSTWLAGGVFLGRGSDTMCLRSGSNRVPSTLDYFNDVVGSRENVAIYTTMPSPVVVGSRWILSIVLHLIAVDHTTYNIAPSCVSHPIGCLPGLGRARW